MDPRVNSAADKHEKSSHNDTMSSWYGWATKKLKLTAKRR